MTTVQQTADSAAAALDRPDTEAKKALVASVLGYAMAGFDLPHRAIREQIASAVDMIVHLERLPNGKRKVVKVSEVHGLEQSTIVMQDVFALAQYGDICTSLL